MSELLPPNNVHYLLSDPALLGALAWIGFAGTFIGLGIAIWQIRQVRTETEATADAIATLSATVQSRERLLDLSTALRLLDSARHHIAQRDYSKAAIFLEFARSECVQVQELIAENPSQKKTINAIVIRITKLVEAVTLDEAQEQQDETSVQRGLEARGIVDGVNAMLARMRYHYSDDGTEQ